MASVLASSSAAYAYFAGSTATTHATVKTNTAFTVDLDQSPTGAALYPGGPTQTYGWSFYNNTSSPEQVTSITASIVTDANGGIYDINTNSYNDNCLASWFTATISTNGLGLPFMLNGNGGLDGPTAANSPNALTVTMVSSTANQSACEGTSPQVMMSVS